MKLNIEIKKYKIKPKTQFIKIYCFGFENLDLLSKFKFWFFQFWLSFQILALVKYNVMRSEIVIQLHIAI
jgi:hypothetical protein